MSVCSLCKLNLQTNDLVSDNSPFRNFDTVFNYIEIDRFLCSEYD